MQDAFKLMRAKGRMKRLDIVKIAHDQFGIGVNGLPVARAQIIVNHDIVATLDQQLNDVAANVTGATGHQDLHHVLPPSRSAAANRSAMLLQNIKDSSRLGNVGLA